MNPSPRPAGAATPSFVNKDACAGLFCIGIGSPALYTAWGYPVGNSLAMGPGYFPRLLGGLLVLLGLVNLLRGLRARETKRVGPLAWWPWVLVPASVLLFGLLIDHAGLAAAVLAVVLVSRLGARALQPIEVAATCVILVGIACLLFFYGLNLPSSVLLPH